MSSYEMGFQYDVNWGYVEKSIDLIPEKYLKYDTIKEVEWAVQDDCHELFTVGDLEVDQAEMIFRLPDEFVQEWKCLKGLE